MVLVQNSPFFKLSFFFQYRPAKCVLWYSRTRKRLSSLKKQKISENQKIQIFSKGLVRGSGLKLAIFPTYFLGDKGQENLVYYILKRKNNFLAYKNNRFYKAKDLNFSKGVTPWFWSKISHFSNFFFC